MRGLRAQLKPLWHDEHDDGSRCAIKNRGIKTKSQLDYLDELAERMLEGHGDILGGLSTDERIYAAIGANLADLLPPGYIVQAIARLDDDTAALIERWEPRG
jgi:hypothetical protein